MRLTRPICDLIHVTPETKMGKMLCWRNIRLNEWLLLIFESRYTAFWKVILWFLQYIPSCMLLYACQQLLSTTCTGYPNS